MTEEEITIIEDFIEKAKTQDKIEMKPKHIGLVAQMIYEIWEKEVKDKDGKRG